MPRPLAPISIWAAPLVRALPSEEALKICHQMKQSLADRWAMNKALGHKTESWGRRPNQGQSPSDSSD